MASFKKMFSYGYKLMVSQLLGSFFSNLNSLLIGKYIGARDLGFYSRGIQFSDVVYSVFSSALNNVLLPGLAPVQDDKKVLVSMTRTIIKTSALITLPVFLGLAVLAEPIILVILTKKWAFAIPIMQIFCIARFITTIVVVNINLLYVIGRTDLVLRQQYLCIAVRVILVIIALQYGIIYIALAELASTSIHFFINSYYPGKFMNYGGLSQIKDLLKIIFPGLFMALMSYFLMLFINNDFLELLIVPPVGILLYWGAVYLLKIPEYYVAIDKARGFMKGKD
jgi:O-antigen/teichoic acid export membrane protein